MISVPLRRDRYREAAQTLARAFHDDPGFAWVFPDEDRRESRIQWILNRWIDVIARAGASQITPESEGVALWAPPGGIANMTLFQQVRRGLLRTPLTLGPRAVARMLRLDRDVKRRQRAAIHDEHWVLDIVGVDPRHQGRGLGRKLIQAGLERVDREARPAFLITHNARTLELYQEYGFDIVSDGPTCRGGPLAWAMVRPARPRPSVIGAPTSDDAEAADEGAEDVATEGGRPSDERSDPAPDATAAPDADAGHTAPPPRA